MLAAREDQLLMRKTADEIPIKTRRISRMSRSGLRRLPAGFSVGLEVIESQRSFEDPFIRVLLNLIIKENEGRLLRSGGKLDELKMADNGGKFWR
jgi:hypothetical protein